jgi:DNA replication protein DnaC
MSESLLLRAKSLKLYGVIAHWEDIKNTDWIEPLIIWEEAERTHRGLERRLDNAKLGAFKSLSDFDWGWPRKCDREMIEDWMGVDFLKSATNLIISGPNGVGKSTIASNIAYQAVIKGSTVLFTTASGMLNDLAAQEGEKALGRRIKHYAQPTFLVCDELGYLSYSNRYADLLFEIISRRYKEKPTLITTNKPFSEWGEIFPNASCVVSLIDRLVHHSEILNIDADSFRLKEAKEKEANRLNARAKKPKA